MNSPHVRSYGDRNVSYVSYFSQVPRTGQQSNPSNTLAELDIIRNEVALQRRARAQRRVPQLFEIDERLIALDEFRPARRLPEGAGCLREAEETIKLGEDPDRAEPNTAIGVELCVEPVLELLDRPVAVLARFLELADSALKRGDDVALGVLETGESGGWSHWTYKVGHLG